MKSYLRIARYVAAAVIFNLVFFLVGGIEQTVAGWIAYAFVHIALIISFVAPLYCINYKRIPENLITIYAFAWIYSALAIILNIVLIMIKTDSIKITLITNAVLLALYFIQLTININVNHAVEKNLETIEAERQFVRDVSSKLKMCMTMVKEQEARKVVEKAYDAVRTSPLHSNEQVMNYEIEVIRLSGKLETAVDAENYEEAMAIAEEIVKNTKKRNAML